MTYRRIHVSDYHDDIRERYKRCDICKKTFNAQQLYGNVCNKCHFPYISLSDFIRANPNNKLIN